ncbi:4a-hydroxytetrahydrobiopterin dehydratase [Luteipulveratus sp. YIM 133132]|uniref:4a-hydroxytetrahydrobiopterin dehydratase n=1 Tax=Luteipulveratus flavus TaxID=3031728 RepID=UPI0023AEB67A|nr:4a-hydroxytetrahydrobiopterin dehydratase [Luteipulveratus sp. YIM 133132]MDE9365546.1 4a-hydroxytetrahydrobiopterin dehydratase [Luteipulveratus sp. YIM 133132]
MTDEKQKLTATQVSEAGIDDWRPMLGRIKARFRTGDFATGLALVTKIGEAAEAAQHHPDVALTYPEVLVTLSSHDVGGITSRDIDLARRISGFAAELGAEADVSGLTQLELGLDTTRSEQNAPFYAALFGGEVKGGEPVDPSGQVPTVWWQDPTEEDPEHALPEQSFEQRWHFDVWVPHDEGERRLKAVLDAGGRLVSDGAAPSFWVIEDADGNRSCICTPAGR